MLFRSTFWSISSPPETCPRNSAAKTPCMHPAQMNWQPVREISSSALHTQHAEGYKSGGQYPTRLRQNWLEFCRLSCETAQCLYMHSRHLPLLGQSSNQNRIAKKNCRSVGLISGSLHLVAESKDHLMVHSCWRFCCACGLWDKQCMVATTCEQHEPAENAITAPGWPISAG